MKSSNCRQVLECAGPLSTLESLPSRELGAPAASLINTVALARCPRTRRNGELFQQFVCRRRKPLKRLNARTSCFHRAKAAVLMRSPSTAGGLSGLVGSALYSPGVASCREKAIAPSRRAKLCRSVMFIANVPRMNQAPLGTACRRTSSRRRGMPLLTELKTSFLGLGGYKHGAPDGALALLMGLDGAGFGKVHARGEDPVQLNSLSVPHD
jgi:hypothetical protein